MRLALLACFAGGLTCIASAGCRMGDDRAFLDAVQAGDMERVHAYLRAGTSPDATWKPRGLPLPGWEEDGPRGTSAITLAVASGHHEIVRVLLDAGADPNRRGRLGNALEVAVARWHTGIVVDLVRAGARLSDPAVLPVGAAERGDLDVIEALIGANADLEVTLHRGHTPLTAAAAAGKGAAVTRLLRAGVDVNRPDGRGTSALMWASRNRHHDVVEILRKAGATADGLAGLELCEAVSRGDHARVGDLLRSGAPVDARDPSGETALILATRTGDSTLVKDLLAAGADVNARSWHGVTVLLWPIANGQVALVRVLLEAGADIEAATGSPASPPLVHAARAGDEAIVRLLVETGADLRARDALGRTAMQQTGGHPHIAAILRAAGARE